MRPKVMFRLLSLPVMSCKVDMKQQSSLEVNCRSTNLPERLQKLNYRPKMLFWLSSVTNLTPKGSKWWICNGGQRKLNRRLKSCRLL